MGKRIVIFRTGSHVAADGSSVDFTEADMAGAVESYDPAKHHAPLVIGHPRTDAPAYGWVEGLSNSRGRLIADADQVNADFAELVKGGAYKHVSASFYRPESKSNPAPGNYYLRHVGFLGAQPPAIKGLDPVEFADQPEDCLTVEFGEDRATALGRWIMARFGCGESGVSWLNQAEFSEPGPKPEETKPAQPDKQDPDKEEIPVGKTPEQDAADKKLKRREEELEKREAEFAEREALAGATDFVDGLVKDRKLTKGLAEGLAEFMAKLPDGEKDVVSFSETDGAKPTTPRQFAKDFLTGLGKVANFSELSAEDGTDQDTTDPKDLAERAVSFREARAAQGITITTAQAVEAVKAGKDKEK